MSKKIKRCTGSDYTEISWTNGQLVFAKIYVKSDKSISRTLTA